MSRNPIIRTPFVSKRADLAVRSVLVLYCALWILSLSEYGNRVSEANSDAEIAESDENRGLLRINQGLWEEKLAFGAELTGAAAAIADLKDAAGRPAKGASNLDEAGAIEHFRTLCQGESYSLLLFGARVRMIAEQAAARLEGNSGESAPDGEGLAPIQYLLNELARAIREDLARSAFLN